MGKTDRNTVKIAARDRSVALERKRDWLGGYWGRSQHLNFRLLLGNY